MENPQKPQPLEEIQERWLSGHLYYHESLDPVVQGFVCPLVVSLIRGEQIDAFFFVRYSLGGPHIRLRLRTTPAAKESVLAAMQQAAHGFLELTPSTRSLGEAAIRRSNEAILAADPQEVDDAAYPDNSFRLVPFRPEIERYGGPSRFRTSLDLFTLSSVAAVDFVSTHQDTPRSAQLAHAFRLLLQQALGFAADETELLDLLRYGVDSWGGILPKVVEKGDRVAQAQRSAFVLLFQESLAGVRSLHAGREAFAGTADFLIAGARRLSAAVGAADRGIRARIGGSQLHMTASRLGLSNAEEVYLSRLLTATHREARCASDEDLSWLGEKMTAGSAEDPEEALGNLLSPALAVLAGSAHGGLGDRHVP